MMRVMPTRECFGGAASLIILCEKNRMFFRHQLAKYVQPRILSQLSLPQWNLLYYQQKVYLLLIRLFGNILVRHSTTSRESRGVLYFVYYHLTIQVRYVHELLQCCELWFGAFHGNANPNLKNSKCEPAIKDFLSSTTPSIG